MAIKFNWWFGKERQKERMLSQDEMEIKASSFIAVKKRLICISALHANDQSVRVLEKNEVFLLGWFAHTLYSNGLTYFKILQLKYIWSLIYEYTAFDNQSHSSGCQSTWSVHHIIQSKTLAVAVENRETWRRVMPVVSWCGQVCFIGSNECYGFRRQAIICLTVVLCICKTLRGEWGEERMKVLWGGEMRWEMIAAGFALFFIIYVPLTWLNRIAKQMLNLIKLYWYIYWQSKY